MNTDITQTQVNNTEKEQPHSIYNPENRIKPCQKNLIRDTSLYGSIPILLIVIICFLLIWICSHQNLQINNRHLAVIGIIAIAATTFIICYITKIIATQQAIETARIDEMLIELYKEEQMRSIKKNSEKEDSIVFAKKKLEIIEKAKSIDPKNYDKEIQTILKEILPH